MSFAFWSNFINSPIDQGAESSNLIRRNPAVPPRGKIFAYSATIQLPFFSTSGRCRWNQISFFFKIKWIKLFIAEGEWRQVCERWNEHVGGCHVGQIGFPVRHPRLMNESPGGNESIFSKAEKWGKKLELLGHNCGRINISFDVLR
jgi:hypothetical protein